MSQPPLPVLSHHGFIVPPRALFDLYMLVELNSVRLYL